MQLSIQAKDHGERRQLLRNAMRSNHDGVVGMILALEKAVAELTETV